MVWTTSITMPYFTSPFSFQVSSWGGAGKCVLPVLQRLGDD